MYINYTCLCSCVFFSSEFVVENDWLLISVLTFKLTFNSLLLIDLQGARLIGVDSLGMDVRVFSGAEVKTHRFPFKVPVSILGCNELYNISGCSGYSQWILPPKHLADLFCFLIVCDKILFFHAFLIWSRGKVDF